MAAGAEQGTGQLAVVAALAAVHAGAVVPRWAGLGAGVHNAEKHAPPRWGVARVGDEIRIERQPAPGAYVPPLAQKQARPFHVHPPVACQHGSHPLSRAHKKGAARPWKPSTDAPRPDGVKISAAKTDSAILSVCLIIAPAMGLSRKIGGFLMAGASFFGDRSLYYTINPGDAHGSFSVKKEP